MLDTKKLKTTPSVTANPKVKRRRIVAIADSDSEDSENQSAASNKKPPPKEPETKPPVSSKLAQFQNTEKDFSAKEAKSTPAKEIKSTPAKKPTESVKKEVELFDDEPTQWMHLSVDFLRPDKIKDASGRRPDHPEYDPRTLFVPESFLNSQTPGMRQWWVLKSQYFDCILFFKVGKFYEMYHMDAVISVQELQFVYMKGNLFAHTGMPESSYHKTSSTLIDKGYRVARIEQTETPDMMEERRKRLKQTSKYDKVVKREVCQLSHRGTQVYGQQCHLPQDADPNYMLTICEKVDGNSSRYGICLIETSLGRVIVGEFDDDSQCSRLLALLSQYSVALILHQRQNVSPHTMNIFRTGLMHVPREPLTDKSQMLTGEKTLQMLHEKYFSKEKGQNFPDVLRPLLSEDDHLGLTPHPDYVLALRALGGSIWYLQRALLANQVIPSALFAIHTPPDEVIEKKEIARSSTSNRVLILDAITIVNLQLLTSKHSLYNTLNMCSTNFGKRLLYQWICAPSGELKVIKRRQEAVTALLDDTGCLQDTRKLLSGLGDMERLLAQIKVFAVYGKDKDHPDSRAILFEAHQYGKKKIQDFCNILSGFEKIFQVPKLFKGTESALLKHLTQFAADGGSLADLREDVESAMRSFDKEAALKSGTIEPKPGMSPEFDAIEEEIKGIEDELREYVKEQEVYFKCRITIGVNRNRCQMEIPEKNANKGGSEYFLESQFKSGSEKMRRYHTSETKEFLQRITASEDKRKALLLDFSRLTFEKFANNHEGLKVCVNNMAILDVLCSFAEYSRNLGTACEPEFVDSEDGPVLEMEEGYHPNLNLINDYIPNGITLGTYEPTISLLTGPNMGGKSTLMRQVGLLVILAHLGCRVPAAKLRLSLCDRIFTRLGARDDIISGQSTFFMELNETSAILKHATQKSFVLLDELGRGTCTYDGTSIAIAVLNDLMQLQCRTIFSTHYHNLVESVQEDKRIALGHMACMVENENDEDPTEECVTFLYKYTQGQCPKSYGFNAAKIAGVPTEIIRRGYAVSERDGKITGQVFYNSPSSITDRQERRAPTVEGERAAGDSREEARG